jgi:hypothetical protein
MMEVNASVVQVMPTFEIFAPSTGPVALAMVQVCPSGWVAMATV